MLRGGEGRMASRRGEADSEREEQHDYTIFYFQFQLLTKTSLELSREEYRADSNHGERLMSTMVSLPRVYDKVIFDMDGTLVNSQAVVERAWRKWALQHGVSADEVLTVSHGRRTHETVQLFASDGMDIAREASELEAAETADVADICPIPGALELLRWIPNADWAVVTSATRQLALRRLSAAGLPVPNLLIAAEDVTIGKPHPQGYLLAIERLGACAPDCLVFEDAHAGILAAKAAGCDVVAITGARPHNFHADCPAILNFNCLSFSLKSRRWRTEPPSA